MPRPRLHADEVHIDTELARRLVVEQMPEYAGQPIQRVNSGGTENAVFRLGTDLALRMPIQPGAVSSLLKEARWLAVVAPHVSLDVPEFIAVGHADAGYPFPWAVVRWLPGEDAMTGQVGSLTDLACKLAEFVLELQGIEMTDAPPPGSEGFGRGGPIAGNDAAFRAALVECEGLLDVGGVAEVWDDALAAPLWDGPPVWIHADLLPTNLLVRDGRLAGVLDFGTMATGDPAYDVTAAWHVLDRASRPTFLEIVQPDDATWRRARGLIVLGAIAVPYYLHTNSTMVAVARRGIEQVLDDV